MRLFLSIGFFGSISQQLKFRLRPYLIFLFDSLITFNYMTKRIIQLVVLFIFILFSCIRSNISNKQADTGFEIIEIDDIHAKKEILLSDLHIAY